MGAGAFTSAVAAADSATERTPTGGSPARPMEATLLSLQRTVGNAAVTRLVRGRGILARCGGGGCSCGGSCGKRDPHADEELLGAGRNALKRAVAARAVQREATVERPAPARRRRQLQRVPYVSLPFFSPTYKPGDATRWTTRVPCSGLHLRDPEAIERCESDCTPYGDAVTASLAWHGVAEAIDAILEGGIAQATHGSHFLVSLDVHSAYHAYLTGTGQPHFHWTEPADSNGAVLRSMKDDTVHHPAAEDPIMSDIRDHHLAELVARPGVAVPLSTLGIAQDQRPGAPTGWPGLDLAFNDGPYGLLFGGTGDGVTADSEYGPDLRELTGWVTATGAPAGPSGGCTRYVLQFDFDWHVKDAVDFCPGNTEPHDAFVHDYGMLGAMSRLEASGMARDILVEAHYRRTRTLGALFCPPPPAPPCRQVVLHEDTFHFPLGASIPDTDDTAVYAELERAYGGRGLPQLDSRLTTLNVVGHTDSHGEDHGFDNVGLSRARAQYVADLLARYPADHSTPPVLAARGIRTVVVAMGATGAAATDRDPPGDIHGRYLGPGPGTPAYANRRVEIQPVGPACPP